MNMMMKPVPHLQAKLATINWRVDMIILISRGVSIVEACSILGVSRSTFYRHLQKDQDFEHQVDRARTIVSLELFETVKASNDWRAAAWLLEKRFPMDYGTARDRLRYQSCSCGASAKIMR